MKHKFKYWKIFLLLLLVFVFIYAFVFLPSKQEVIGEKYSPYKPIGKVFLTPANTSLKNSFKPKYQGPFSDRSIILFEREKLKGQVVFDKDLVSGIYDISVPGKRFQIQYRTIWEIVEKSYLIGDKKRFLKFKNISWSYRHIKQGKSPSHKTNFNNNNFGVGKPHIINKTEGVRYGPVVTITCGQKKVQPVSVKPQLLTFRTKEGLLVKRKTPLVSFVPPAFTCEEKCGKGVKSYSIKSRLITIEYVKENSSKGAKTNDRMQCVDSTQSLINSKPCR